MHQDVAYTTCKQYGIDFAIGKEKNNDKKTDKKPFSRGVKEETKSRQRMNSGNNPGKLKSQEEQMTSMGFR